MTKLDFFWKLTKINTFTFGGGYTIVPLLRDEFVKKQENISEQEMMNIITLAQSGPGAIAINTSLLLGYKLFGFSGALLALLASSIPCLISTVLVYLLYAQFSSNHMVQTILTAMAGAICAILLVTVYQMTKTVMKQHPLFSLSLAISSFVASYFLNIQTVIILIGAGLIGLFVFGLLKLKEVA